MRFNPILFQSGTLYTIQRRMCDREWFTAAGKSGQSGYSHFLGNMGKTRVKLPNVLKSGKGAGFPRTRPIPGRDISSVSFPVGLWAGPAPMLKGAAIPFPTKARYIPSAIFPLSAPCCAPVPTPSRNRDLPAPVQNSFASAACSFAVAAGSYSESAP